MSCDLHTPGWLAKHWAAALLLFLAGAAAFAALSYQLMTNGPMVQLDQQVSAASHALASKTPGQVLEFMTYGFFMGKENLQVLAVILVLYFLYKRYWEELAMVLIGWSGGTLVWTPLIYYFNRMRPKDQIGIEVHTIPSFPSGHSMFAMLALGLLTYMLAPRMPSAFWRWLVAAAGILGILFVGYSRVFENGHYLSDVLAGYALGIAWGVLVYTPLEALAVWRRHI